MKLTEEVSVGVIVPGAGWRRPPVDTVVKGQIMAFSAQNCQGISILLASCGDRIRAISPLLMHRLGERRESPSWWGGGADGQHQDSLAIVGLPVDSSTTRKGHIIIMRRKINMLGSLFHRSNNPHLKYAVDYNMD